VPPVMPGASASCNASASLAMRPSRSGCRCRLANQSRHSASRLHPTAASSTASSDIGGTVRPPYPSTRSPSSSDSRHRCHPHAPTNSPTTALPLFTHRPRPRVPPARARRAQHGPSSCDASSPSTSSRARIAGARAASSHNAATRLSWARSSRISDCPTSLHGPRQDLFQGTHANKSTSPEPPLPTSASTLLARHLRGQVGPLVPKAPAPAPERASPGSPARHRGLIRAWVVHLTDRPTAANLHRAVDATASGESHPLGCPIRQRQSVRNFIAAGHVRHNLDNGQPT
jgi:hypothetical protein